MTTGYNVVDSSAWLEFLDDGPNADDFAPAIEDTPRLIVPAVVITEVLRRLDASERRQLVPDVLMQMRRGTVVPYDGQFAVDAAVLGRRHRLALADSMIFATAQQCRATVWTQDEDFETLPDVEYRPHRTR